MDRQILFTTKAPSYIPIGTIYIVFPLKERHLYRLILNDIKSAGEHCILSGNAYNISPDTYTYDMESLLDMDLCSITPILDRCEYKTIIERLKQEFRHVWYRFLVIYGYIVFPQYMDLEFFNNSSYELEYNTLQFLFQVCRYGRGICKVIDNYDAIKWLLAKLESRPVTVQCMKVYMQELSGLPYNIMENLHMYTSLDSSPLHWKYAPFTYPEILIQSMTHMKDVNLFDPLVYEYKGEISRPKLFKLWDKILYHEDFYLLPSCILPEQESMYMKSLPIKGTEQSLIFGSLSKGYIIVDYQELVDWFIVKGDFLVPYENRKLTNSQITRLFKRCPEDILTQLQVFSKRLVSYIQVLQYEFNDILIKFLIDLFDFGMYIRRWTGIRGKYPIHVEQTQLNLRTVVKSANIDFYNQWSHIDNDYYLFEAFIGNLLRELHITLTLCPEFNKIPLIGLGKTVGHILDELSNKQCIRLASKPIVQTAYNALKILNKEDILHVNEYDIEHMDSVGNVPTGEYEDIDIEHINEESDPITQESILDQTQIHHVDTDSERREDTDSERREDTDSEDSSSSEESDTMDDSDSSNISSDDRYQMDDYIQDDSDDEILPQDKSLLANLETLCSKNITVPVYNSLMKYIVLPKDVTKVSAIRCVLRQLDTICLLPNIAIQQLSSNINLSLCNDDMNVQFELVIRCKKYVVDICRTVYDLFLLDMYTIFELHIMLQHIFKTELLDYNIDKVNTLLGYVVEKIDLTHTTSEIIYQVVNYVLNEYD